MPAQVLNGPAVATHMYQALFGKAPSNALYTSYIAQIGTTDGAAFAASLTTGFATTTDAALATMVLANLGVTATTMPATAAVAGVTAVPAVAATATTPAVAAVAGVTAVAAVTSAQAYAALESALTQMFTGYGVSARGQIILNMTNLLANLEGDKTFGTIATTYNNQTLSNFTYASNAANTVPVAVTPVDPTTAAGQTFTLTTGIDNITGTGGNDTIIGDNSGGTATATAGDQINGGAGADTFKLYSKTTDAIDALTLPQLSNVETLYLANGTLTDAKTFDASVLTGVTNLTIDGTVAIADTKSFTVKEAASQSLSLTKVNVAGTGTTGKLNLSGVSTVNLNATGTSTTDTGALTLDLTTTGAALTLNSTGAASKVTLANTGAALATLTVTGDQTLTITEGLAGLKTINASAATGSVVVDASTATVPVAFAFTGGSGNDSLKIKAGALGLLTAGSQLDGGAGTDTLVTSETATLTSAQFATINATKNFEVLGFGVDASGADISKLTTINQFKIAAKDVGATFSNALSTSSFVIDNTAGNTKTIVIGNKVGENVTTVNVDTGTAGAAVTLAKLDVTGISTANLSSTGVATKAGGANVITDIVNSDNTSIVIKGDTDLTITKKLVATTVGSKVDASAFTGKLSVIGSDKADVLIGGSGADTLQGGDAGKAAGIGNTMTGGAGADTFVFSAASYTALLTESAGTTAVTRITDFTAGVDKINLTDTVATTTSITLATAQTVATAADLTAVYAGITAIGASSATGAQSGVVVTVSGGAAAGTYLYINDATGTVSNTADMLINITGITGTLTANDFIFA